MRNRNNNIGATTVKSAIKRQTDERKTKRW